MPNSIMCWKSSLTLFNLHIKDQRKRFQQPTNNNFFWNLSFFLIIYTLINMNTTVSLQSKVVRNKVRKKYLCILTTSRTSSSSSNSERIALNNRGGQTIAAQVQRYWNAYGDDIIKWPTLEVAYTNVEAEMLPYGDSHSNRTNKHLNWYNRLTKELFKTHGKFSLILLKGIDSCFINPLSILYRPPDQFELEEEELACAKFLCCCYSSQEPRYIFWRSFWIWTAAVSRIWHQECSWCCWCARW